MGKLLFSEHFDEKLHYQMTLFGGFLGGYAICLGGAFGSAQTGNLMNMVIDEVYGDYVSALCRLGAFLLYITSIATSFVLGRKIPGKMRYLTLAVDMAALLITMFLPHSVPTTVWLYPLFVASSFQWGTFSGAEGKASASIFITGNLKNSVVSWMKYFLDHDKKERRKAVFYTITVTSFLFGVAFGSECVKHFGRISGLIGIGYLLVITAELLWKDFGSRRGLTTGE